MPRASDLKRAREIREYFSSKYAAVVDDPNEVKADIIQRFRLNGPRDWYRWKGELKKLIVAAREEGGGGTLVTEPIPEEPQEEGPGEDTIEIPTNLTPAAKAVVNVLLAKNQELAATIQAKELELGAQRAQIVAQQKRSTLLKKIVYDTVDAL